MIENISSRESIGLTLTNSRDVMLNVQRVNSLRPKIYNQQLNSILNSPETIVTGKLSTQIQTRNNQMNRPINSYIDSLFTSTQKKISKTNTESESSPSRPPLSPKQQFHVKNAPSLHINNEIHQQKKQNDERSLGIRSAKNSDSDQEKNTHIKSSFNENQQVNQLQSQNFEFALPLNEKMITLQNKSNRLIQKVFAIQQQIRKYVQVEQKQLKTIAQQAPASPLLQTKSLLNKRQESQQLDPFLIQHQQSIRKMNILGRNKVKMIENLEIHIQSLEQKVLHPEQKKAQDIEQEKNQIDSKFANYYKHKNDIIKQSKSEKFSFKHFKYLTKQNKLDKDDQTEQIVETFEGKENQENLQIQLKKLKEQFSSYQERTSKQLQNYKERLNQNILQKEILKKQLQQQKYENLKEKIFNKNKPMKTSRIISPVKTARNYVEAKFNQKTSRDFVNSNFTLNIKLEEKPFDQVEQNIVDLMNLPKTKRQETEQVPELQDLEQFKDEVSMRYVEENEQIQGLNEKIKDMEQIIEDLRSRFEKGYLQFMAETEELKNLLDEKQATLAELSDINECNLKQIEDLKNEINDMNNYIFQCKEEHEQQNDQIEEYKNVIQEFVEEVKNLRNQLGEKNVQNDQIHQNLEEAEKINKLCENQISQLEKQNQSLKKEIQKLENQIKLKEAKQRYTEALLQKQKNKETADNSIISEHSSKNQSKLSHSLIGNTQSKIIKDLRQQNQQKLDLQRIEFNNVLKQKDAKIQQLEENLHLINNEISHKVDQEVNEGIRTFLRYRKHTNHLTQQNMKIIIYGKKIYSGNKFENIQFDTNFKEIKIETTKNKNKVVVACKTDTSQGSNLSLRKLIDAKFNIKLNLIKSEQLPLKLHISLKLIEFAMHLIHQEGNSQQISSKSIKSSKKLPSLHPESIYAIEQQIQESESKISQLSTQQRVQKFEQNFKSYQFIYFMGNKKQTENKKDKNLVYLSPQVLLSMNESENSYCWTLGIIIDQIFNNRPFYTKIDEIVTRKDNYKFQDNNCHDEETRSNLMNILEKMVRKNMKERPSLQSVHDHFNKMTTQC